MHFLNQSEHFFCSVALHSSSATHNAHIKQEEMRRQEKGVSSIEIFAMRLCVMGFVKFFSVYSPFNLSTFIILLILLLLLHIKFYETMTNNSNRNDNTIKWLII